MQPARMPETLHLAEGYEKTRARCAYEETPATVSCTRLSYVYEGDEELQEALRKSASFLGPANASAG